jgi:hypothetical protein
MCHPPQAPRHLWGLVFINSGGFGRTQAAYTPIRPRFILPNLFVLRLAPLLVALALAACAHQPAPLLATKPKPAPGRFLQGPRLDDPRVPAFANDGWAPFTRQAVAAIALREWRLFGQNIDDDPPETRPIPPPDLKPEREEGLWQRIGEYWWISQDPDSRQAGWTGKHDETGTIFPAGQDGNYAWSAAFISYVMRIAGAGARFPYSQSHSTYINLAAAGANASLRAYPPQTYAPLQGDLICTGRGRSAKLHFADLPTAAPFPSHCDIVVAVSATQLTVMGGNVDDTVTEKHVPVAPGGMLAGPDGVPADTRYPWFVVVKILYDNPLPTD